MEPPGREKRSLKAMWRDHKARRRARMAARPERLSRRHKIDDTPEGYEQAVRSVHTSGGGFVP
jgi:hypothetical protein